MRKSPLDIFSSAVCAAIIAGIALNATMSCAGPLRPQPQPPVFAPNCAVRPRCIVNTCMRSGRCKLGGQIQAVGCLFYACGSAPR